MTDAKKLRFILVGVLAALAIALGLAAPAQASTTTWVR
jgi:hypothetical protein